MAGARGQGRGGDLWSLQGVDRVLRQRQRASAKAKRGYTNMATPRPVEANRVVKEVPS